jgi:hypothetical protein
MLPGCAYRYANVYVNAVTKSSHTSVSMDIYSGRDGLHLGETPLTVPIKKRGSGKYPMSLLARGGVNGCPTYWEIVNVANWGTSPQEAADATKKNEVLFLVNDQDVVCTR